MFFFYNFRIDIMYKVISIEVNLFGHISKNYLEVNMNRRYKKHINKTRYRNYIMSHIENNIKNYLIVTLIFVIGIIIGVIFINKRTEVQSDEIKTYINSSVTLLKENNNIDTFLFLKNSIKNNILIAIFLWFMGSTVIGISIVYFTICFRGFCLGYTISSVIISIGIGKGIIFFISALFLQNILFIPCIFALAVSGMKLHRFNHGR